MSNLQTETHRINNGRIGFLLGELAAHGAGWQTLSHGELRNLRVELETRLGDAKEYGCTGCHETGCHACYLIRVRSVRS